MPHRTDPAAALREVRARIASLERRYARAPGSVTLLAVSKTRPAEDLRRVHDAGQRRFAENQVQEALPKLEALADLPIEWHFIGPLQANKTRPVASHFDWVHSIDRVKIARRLDDQRPEGLSPLQVCIQVNISGEASKAGVAPDEAADLAREVVRFPRLRLRGLMAIPAPCTGLEAQRAALRPLVALYERLCEAGFALDTLSMGMSQDLEAAIAEGATLVRIGTAIFGARPPHGR